MRNLCYFIKNLIAKTPRTQLLLSVAVISPMLACQPSDSPPVGVTPATQWANEQNPEAQRPRPNTELVNQLRPPTPTPKLPSLPEHLKLGSSIERQVRGDRPLRVAHAPAPNQQALIYLHGMCGNSKGAEPWLKQALKRGTLIVVRANIPCPDRPGYKWPKSAAAIQKRIETALELVKGDRSGLLNTEQVTLIGYSQGAHRAERLAELKPSMYPRVVLGGAPTLSDDKRLQKVQALAYLGGSKEKRDHMEESQRLMREAGLNARFFLLPGAPHGSYGRQGPQVMARVFQFLFGEIEQ